jgi:aspartate/methionine/tyrosine aminotransferase
LAQNLYISAPAIAHAAALGSFDGLDELDANRAVYEANRALLLEELPKAGFTSFAPADGAFYLYCDVSEMTNDAVSFAKAMLEEAGVATTPGVDFDAERGHRFLRFCYAGTRQDMAEAARRIAEWAPTRRQR